MPAPPYSSSTVTPRTPRSPSLRQRPYGNSLRASISAARGATSAAAKRATSARRASGVSPRPRSRPWGLLSMMGLLPRRWPPGHRYKRTYVRLSGWVQANYTNERVFDYRLPSAGAVSTLRLLGAVPGGVSWVAPLDRMG